MNSTIIMPQLGETVVEGKILTWFKKVGDDIKIGDRLFEVETDKVTVEIEATNAGKLTEIRVGDGVTAKIGSVVAVIDGGIVAAPSAPTPEVKKPAALFRSAFEEVATPITNYGSVKGPYGMRVTPLARRLISQNGLDLSQIANTVSARGGKRIREDDVLAAMKSKPIASAIPLEGTAIPLSGIRQKAAERLAENWRNIPHVFQAIDVDFSAVEAVRSKHKEEFRKANGIALTYLPFIASAVAVALREFPNINARFDGKSLALSRDINLGIAVDLDHKGLVVPVVRNVEDLRVSGIAKAIARQVEKARSGKLTADDFGAGTYSITNNGAFGTMFTSPIINAPQVAILSTDAIRKRPMVVDTPQGEFIAARLVGIIGQSFDHRAFDGAYAAAYLARLKKILEERNWLEELES